MVVSRIMSDKRLVNIVQLEEDDTFLDTSKEILKFI